MKNLKYFFCAFSFVSILFVSCNQQSKNIITESTQPLLETKTISLIEEVLTKEKQDALTPNDVIQSFKAGNMRFMKNDLTARDHSSQVRKSTKAQYPEAIVLSCVDSRVPVENIFDKGIGDIFVARVAGNFVNEDILGSMEYACKVAGSKLILVMGHENCGAVKSTVDDVQLGNITNMLAKIKPAIETLEYEGERTSKNKEFLDLVGENNVLNTIKEIRLNSPILKEMESTGEIKIVGAVYDMDNGEVKFVN